MTHPSPPECIFRTLLSAVHPQKQRHLIKVHFAAKSFIHYIFRMCSVRQKKKKESATIIGSNSGSHFQGFSGNSTALSLSLSLINTTMCGDTLQNKANRTFHPHAIHNIVCLCVGWEVCVSVCVVVIVAEFITREPPTYSPTQPNTIKQRDKANNCSISGSLTKTT